MSEAKDEIQLERLVKFPMEQYMALVCSAENAYPHWRYGQILFNVLHDGWPDLANQIRGGSIDPFFYKNRTGEPIDRFFKWLAEI